MNSKLILILSALAIQSLDKQVAAASQDSLASKIFNYKDVMPIKEESAGDESQNATKPAENNEEDAEAACWRFVKEASGKINTLQTLQPVNP